MIEFPCVSQGWRADTTEHCQLAVFTFGGAFGRSGCGERVFRDRRKGGEATDLKGGEARHVSCSYLAECLTAAVGDFGVLGTKKLDFAVVD